MATFLGGAPLLEKGPGMPRTEVGVGAGLSASRVLRIQVWRRKVGSMREMDSLRVERPWQNAEKRGNLQIRASSEDCAADQESCT